MKESRSNEIINQINFIEELMNRLHKDIKDMVEHEKKYEFDKSNRCLQNHSRYKNDIIKIRREYLRLVKMMDWVNMYNV